MRHVLGVLRLSLLSNLTPPPPVHIDGDSEEDSDEENDIYVGKGSSRRRWVDPDILYQDELGYWLIKLLRGSTSGRRIKRCGECVACVACVACVCDICGVPRMRAQHYPSTPPSPPHPSHLHAFLPPQCSKSQ